MSLFLIVFCFLCAAIPAWVFLSNLRLFRPAPHPDNLDEQPKVSVLVPARDEEKSIRAAVESILGNVGVTLECVVLDDQSSDRTAAIVRDIAQRDPRVRLEIAPSLPSGWNGKQHACFVLSRHAKHEILCFVDADVRLAPNALARMAAFLESSGAPLISGFPRQETGSWLEQLLLPLIHFVLLAFLPLDRMRHSVNPAYAAACGQPIMAKRDAYRATGGHEAIRSSMHDGIQLPRAFRRSGFATDIFDATDIAVCRMYVNASEVWKGLAKNAIEGMAAPSRIGPLSVLLLAGQVVPFLLWPWSPLLLPVALLSWLPRMLAVPRFRQPLLSALLHPLGIAVLISIQWYALIRKLLGKPAAWKNRDYAPSPTQ